MRDSITRKFELQFARSRHFPPLPSSSSHPFPKALETASKTLTLNPNSIMAAFAKPPSRYDSISDHSLSSSDGQNPTKHLAATFSGRRGPSDLIADGSSKALVRANSGDIAVRRNGQNNLGAMVKKFIERRSNTKTKNAGGSADRMALAVPPDVIAKDLKKTGKGPSNLSNIHKKLFQRAGTRDCSEVKALAEVKSNTRSLAMVLRSERELLGQNKEYETQITELHLLLEMKDREVEKLKDLCIKQREEIKTLKDVILFPDLMNGPLQELLEKQGSELKQAKQVIPTLQKQVTSLTGQLQSLVEDLAEVKADKYASCLDDHVSTPRTPICGQNAAYSQEFSSAEPTTPGSPDNMLMNDFNPCLTPFSRKKRTKEIEEVIRYDSSLEDEPLWNTTSNSDAPINSSGVRYVKCPEYCQQPSLAGGARRILVSDKKKLSAGKASKLFQI